METMPPTEEELAGLLRELRPAPDAWVQAAIELPALRATVNDLALLAEADVAVRQAMLANLEEAVRQQGVEPTPRLLSELRARLVG
jgi:hypothetical protein